MRVESPRRAKQQTGSSKTIEDAVDEYLVAIEDVVADVEIIINAIGINVAMCHNIVGHTAHAPIPAGSAKILHKVITTMRLLRTNLGDPPTIVHGLLDSLGVIQQ